jgi:hypothetical protein
LKCGLVSIPSGYHDLCRPQHGRILRAFRFAQKHKTLALGVYPDVSLELARSRHEFARNLLAHGLDPSALKAVLGKQPFAAMMREWGIARGHKSHLEALKDILGALPIAVADEIQGPFLKQLKILWGLNCIGFSVGSIRRIGSR